MQLDDELSEIKQALRQNKQLPASALDKIKEGIEANLPVAGYLVAYLALKEQYPFSYKQDLILNLARRYLVKEIKTHGFKEQNKAREIGYELNTVHNFCEKLGPRNHVASYTSVMLNFAENGLPTKYIATSLDSSFKERPIVLIGMMYLDEILSFSEKMQILGYLDQYYTTFEKTCEEIESPANELIYQYFLDKAQKLVLKKKYLEAIAILEKIPPSADQYADACYAKSLHLRTLYLINRAQFDSQIAPERLDRYITLQSQNLLEPVNTIGRESSTYKDALLHLDSDSKTFLTGESDQPVRQDDSRLDMSKAEQLEAGALSVTFSNGQPRMASFTKKVAFFAAVSAATIKGWQSYTLTRRHFNAEFSAGFSYAGTDLKSCTFDNRIETKQPTLFGPNIMPTFMFTVSYLIPLVMAYKFAHRFGVTGEYKYLAFALAATAMAIGICLTDQMLNDRWQMPIAEREGYNWRWTTANQKGCPAKYHFDNEQYLKALGLSREYNEDLTNRIFLGVDSPVLAFIAKNLFSQNSIHGLLLLLTATMLLSAFKAGRAAPKAEIVIDEERSAFELR